MVTKTSKSLILLCVSKFPVGFFFFDQRYVSTCVFNSPSRTSYDATSENFKLINLSCKCHNILMAIHDIFMIFARYNDFNKKKLLKSWKLTIAVLYLL